MRTVTKNGWPRRGRWLAASLAGGLILVACSGGGDPPSEARDTDAGSAGSEQVGEPGRFEGVELVLAGAAGQIEYVSKWTDRWAEETGATVKINAIPFTDIDDRVQTATGTDTFLADVYNIGMGMAGQLMAQDRVLEIPADLQDRLSLDTLPSLYRDVQLSWSGTLYAAPWDCDIMQMFYRSDVIDNDPELAQQFEAKYGYALGEPQTWEQYGDIAEFFTEDADWDGSYGLVELPMRRNHAWNGFFARAAAYAKHPSDPAFLFDPDDMTPRIDNPGFVQALEDWVDAMAFGPPDMGNYGWAENMQSFVSGQAALNIQWGDIGPISYDEEMSAIAGKVGYGITPGRTEVWNAQSGSWDEFDEPSHAPWAGFGGWIWVVPDLTEHPEAALDLATYLARPEVLADASVTGGTGVNPCHRALLQDVDFWVERGGLPREGAEAFVASVLTSTDHPNAVQDLRIPGVPEYKDTLEVAVTSALAGEAEAADALSEAAAAWEAITDRLGREEQAGHYRDSLGIE
jgi:multiple sugar transport system substrate-binding protein